MTGGSYVPRGNGVATSEGDGGIPGEACRELAMATFWALRRYCLKCPRYLLLITKPVEENESQLFYKYHRPSTAARVPRYRSRAAASVQSFVDWRGGDVVDASTMELRVSEGEIFEQLNDIAIARKDRSAFVDYVFDTEIRKLKLEAADRPIQRKQ